VAGCPLPPFGVLSTIVVVVVDVVGVVVVVVVIGGVSEGVFVGDCVPDAMSSIDVDRIVGVVVGWLVSVDVVLVMLVRVVVGGDSVVVVLVMSDDVWFSDALVFQGGSINDCIDIAWEYISSASDWSNSVSEPDDVSSM
jgi:hypothetical protein